MEKYRPPGQNGVALLITITVLFVIVALVSEVNRNVMASIGRAHLGMERARLGEMATSGVYVGIGLLMEDKRTTEEDTIHEIWADQETIKEIFSGLSLGEGDVSLTITDELGKIQVNALVSYPDGKEFNPAQKSLWDSFLKLLNPPDESVDSLGQNDDIVNCLKDFLDFGDDDASTGINGAENEYYESLDPPYKAVNGPLRSLDELVLVKGITEDMVNRVEMGYKARDLLTVYGMIQPEQKTAEGTKGEKKSLFTYPGKININTADLPVIMALMPDNKSDLENSIAAQAIFDYRAERTEDGFVNDLKGTWYLKCPGCEDSGIRTDIITTASDFYSIVCKAATKETAFTVSAVIRRDDKNGKYTILGWDTD
jgi:general secretion pathway protein K